MNLSAIKQIFYREKRPTLIGWLFLASVIGIYVVSKNHAEHKREQAKALSQSETQTPSPSEKNNSKPAPSTLPETPLPPLQVPIRNQTPTISPATPSRQYREPSFGNLQTTGKILSDDFLPKGTILYATLTSDIVSNNQVSPATATIIYPAIFAHKVRIPVGTQVTGRIAPGNLRGRVFVSWDTLIFYEEGRQGWELPIKGIGMTYEQNSHSGRWIINGAGLKGFIFDDSGATAFKLAALKAMQDFAKTLQSLTLREATLTSGSGLVTTTTAQTPEATLKNSGLAAVEGFIDVIASRYSASLQQQNSFVLVPTARLCAIFLEEPIDITTAGPGRSLSR